MEKTAASPLCIRVVYASLIVAQVAWLTTITASFVGAQHLSTSINQVSLDANFDNVTLEEVFKTADLLTGFHFTYHANEWLEYTIDSVTGGSYNMRLTYSSGTNNVGDALVTLDD